MRVTPIQSIRIGVEVQEKCDPKKEWKENLQV
jgi:hypothetical protein